METRDSIAAFSDATYQVCGQTLGIEPFAVLLLLMH